MDSRHRTGSGGDGRGSDRADRADRVVRPGIRAVARAAGVSPTTVSHTFSGSRGVRAETRDRVLRAAATLGYTPNRIAQGLRRRRTGVIGLASDRIATTPFAGRIVQGAQEVAREHDLLLMLVDSEGDRELESRQIRALAAQQVDGVLMARMSHQVVGRPGGLGELRVVLVDGAPEAGWAVDAVVPDEEGIAATAVERFVAAGHRRIAFVNADEDAPAVSGRADGFASALERAGLDAPRSMIVSAQSDAVGGRRAGRSLLDREPVARPTAVFCFNDQMAMGVYQAADALGLAVPTDVSVIGVDDLELVSAALEPGLTTIALPHREMGRAGMKTLLAMIEGAAPREPVTTRLRCELVERGSVASPPV
ncbi:LacI family DNA-binding transcriptional regulator [Agromyces sp. GXQ0307]|uniref:LacI family DNA-binding transcriptional regulator n=1 Tax=Agromyces sp. GXQ0307 TaxID=3377835 RepID=UPI00383BC4C8